MIIRVGEIIGALHKNDRGHKMIHPFLIVSVTKKHTYAIQCTSVKVRDEESYFSRENIPYFEFQFSGLEYVTHVRLNKISKIKNEDIKKSINMSHQWEFNQICNELLNGRWENNAFWNHNQIIDCINKGVENFGQEWTLNN